MELDVLLTGFPGRTNMGFLGLSTVVLLRGSRTVVFDTGAFGSRMLLRERLSERGLDFDDIDAVILSHLHFDHCHNAFLFRKAEYFVHAAELEYAQGHPDDILYPEGIARSLRETGRVNLIESDGEFLPGIYGFHTPGHTPGCLSVRVLCKDRPFVLAGDAIKNLAELVTGQAEMSLDEARSAESMRLIRKQSDSIIPGHDSPLDAENQRRLSAVELRVLLSRGVSTLQGGGEVLITIT